MIIPHFLSNLGMGGSSAPIGPSTLREAFHAKLGSIPELTALVGGRIFFNGLPQKKGASPTFPAVTHYVASRTFGRTLRGPNGVSTGTIRVSCWSKNEQQAAAIADVVREHLDGFQGRWGRVDVMGCFIEDEVDLPEYPRQGTDSYTYQIVLTFSVVHRVG
jgi:Protein of unknown function (DUF3168)